MQITFWGTRGSIAKAGPSTLRYGGNTSCVTVRTDSGTLLVLDCGTGAHGLGQHLADNADGGPSEGHLLISHTHWDHIQGLPFFAPLFDEQARWSIYGPRGLAGSIDEILAGQMQYAYFPVTIEQLAAAVDYHDLVEGSFEIGDVRVEARYLNHPALTLAYRLQADGATVVYASDHEPHHRDLAGGGDLTTSRNDLEHARFFVGADLLIHDAQYLSEEFPEKAGWGHSTVEYVVDVARTADVERLALFHHDPSRTDEAVDQLLERARRLAAASHVDADIFAAAEGQTVELRGDRTPRSSPTTAATPPGSAVGDLRRSILIVVGSTEMATTLREAAEAEQLEVWVSTDPDEAVAVARARRPGIIVLEDGEAPLADFARALGDLDDDGITLVAVSASGAVPTAAGIEITDALTWPASSGYIRTKLRAWLLRRACRWRNAPLPHDEEQRLESLRRLGVLDTGPEVRFDELTALASRLLDVPIALVSLIDADRQWFKSHHGIEAQETPRDMAVCAHAILDDDVLQVPDALKDPRFAENPMVQGEARIRFYAGAPLKLSDGTRAGTLCVLDHRPRTLDDDQVRELRRLAEMVTAELEHRTED